MSDPKTRLADAARQLVEASRAMTNTLTARGGDWSDERALVEEAAEALAAYDAQPKDMDTAKWITETREKIRQFRVYHELDSTPCDPDDGQPYEWELFARRFENTLRMVEQSQRGDAQEQRIEEGLFGCGCIVRPDRKTGYWSIVAPCEQHGANQREQSQRGGDRLASGFELGVMHCSGLAQDEGLHGFAGKLLRVAKLPDAKEQAHPPAPGPEPSRIEELEAIIERERTMLADGVTAIKKAIAARSWLTEGRGSYEWDDDRWHDEFRQAGDEILTALEPLAQRAADLSNSPKTQEKVDAARKPTTAVAQEPPCWHREIGDDGICRNCGSKAAITLDKEMQ